MEIIIVPHKAVRGSTELVWLELLEQYLVYSQVVKKRQLRWRWRNTAVNSWGICASRRFYAFGTNPPKLMTFKNEAHMAMIWARSQQPISLGVLIHWLSWSHLKPTGRQSLTLHCFLLIPTRECRSHHAASLYFQGSIFHLPLITSCTSGVQILQGAYYGIFPAKLDVYLKESLEPASGTIKCPLT